MIEVVVAGLGRAPGRTGVLLLLKERDGPRMLPVGIGPYEAEAIAIHFQGVPIPRPLTHDLLAQVVDRLNGRVRQVELSALTQGTFYARLMVDQAGRELAIDSRPSDAVALAVRLAVPIYVAETVLDEAGVIPEQPEQSDKPEPTEEPGESPGSVDVSKLGVFKEFIDSLGEHEEDPDQP